MRLAIRLDRPREKDPAVRRLGSPSAQKRTIRSVAKVNWSRLVPLS